MIKLPVEKGSGYFVDLEIAHGFSSADKDIFITVVQCKRSKEAKRRNNFSYL